MKTKITENELMAMYDELLNDEGTVHIQGMEMEPAYVLKKCDPIAYNCGLSDYADALTDEYIIEGYNDYEDEEESEEEEVK
jgi:hypothetical protein